MVDSTIRCGNSIYPEVHQAIQTSHAARALLYHQKQKIESLLHQGVLDEAECQQPSSSF